MPCSHVSPMMVLKGVKSSTTKNCTFWIIGTTWKGNTICPKEVVEAPLNLDSIHLGFSRADGGNPIYLNTNICNKLVKLPGSTKTHLTSKLLIPNVRIRASSWGCSTLLGSTEGNAIIPFMGHVLPLGKLVRRELTYSLIEATQSNLCLFHLELYFSSMPPLPMNVIDYGPRPCRSYRDLGGPILGYISMPLL